MNFGSEPEPLGGIYGRRAPMQGTASCDRDPGTHDHGVAGENSVTTTSIQFMGSAF